jgi:hypothetical protein
LNSKYQAISYHPHRRIPLHPVGITSQCTGTVLNLLGGAFYGHVDHHGRQLRNIASGRIIDQEESALLAEKC